MAIEITSSHIFTPEELTKHAKIYAGPGAGKTHFLVENVKNIIATNPLITQSRARKVLCITYTNAAVDEIKRRLDKYTDYVEAYTIHGFIIEHIIQPFQQDLKGIMNSDFGITVSSECHISSQIEGLGILHGIDKKEIYDFIVKTNPSEFTSYEFNYSKKAMSDTEVDNDAFVASVVEESSHQIRLKTNSKVDERHIVPIKKYIWSVVNKLTHNEILYFGYRILESNPTALYAIRVKFPYIFVDEFQDTNPVQTLLVKLIGKKSTVIGVVGDIAQSIYSFQGACPSDFKRFSIEGQRNLQEYVINGNRRSTENVVNFCNFLRQSDSDVIQLSTRPYKTINEKVESESKKIHFLIGNSPTIQDTIQNVLNDDSVVLTRSWAAAFDYIQGIDEAQAKLLRSIYNSYYNSPIQIRDEIAQYNNVRWVRSFRFIFSLWESYLNGSFIDVLRALKLYTTIDVQKIKPAVIYQIRKLSDNVYNGLEGQSFTCQIIDKFNNEISKTEFAQFRESIFEPDFTIPLFDELEDDRFKMFVKGLFWDTSYKLFSEVFSEHSKYMTVHQAKGLEWKKVIVSATPSRFDRINIATLYSKPQLTEEKPEDEFTRLYYVACSRSKEDLYIHIPSGCSETEIKSSLDSFIAQSKKTIAYDFVN